MIIEHTLFSIDLDLVALHVSNSKPDLEDLPKRFSAIREYTGYTDPEFTQVERQTLGRWVEFDEALNALESRMRANPGKTPGLHKPYGEEHYIVGLINDDGTYDYDNLSERSKEWAHEWDPDFFLTQVKGAPSEKYRIALDQWVEDAVNRTPIYTSTLVASIEVKVLWAEMGAELSFQEDQYPDGRVQLTFSISAKIGAAMKGVDVSAGIEGGFLLMHEFDSRAQADAFLKSLREKIITVDPDFVGAAGLLGDSSSLERGVVSVGLYASAKFESPKWAGIEAAASVRVGYARDFVSDQNIMYFGGNAQIGLDADVGGKDIEAKIAVGFDGEQRWSDNGDSYVDLKFSLTVSAGTQLDQIKALFPGLDVRAGSQVLIRSYLELDDPGAIRAWENLLDPFDGSLDLGDFLDRSDLTVQTSSLAEIELLDVDVDAGVASIDIESRATERQTDRLWVRPPGREFLEVEI